MSRRGAIRCPGVIGEGELAVFRFIREHSGPKHDVAVIPNDEAPFAKHWPSLATRGLLERRELGDFVGYVLAPAASVVLAATESWGDE